MNEIPEVLVFAGQAVKLLSGKAVKTVLPPTKKHGFAWFNIPPSEFDAKLKGKRFCNAEGFGMYIEFDFEGSKLAVHDGVNIRFLESGEKAPKDFQLLIVFDDASMLAFTVSMYAGFYCFEGRFDNKYYVLNRDGISALSDEFDEKYLRGLLSALKPSSSLKELLARDQRIPGFGNGVLQDVLFQAKLNPKRKLATLTEEEISELFYCIKAVLAEMRDKGGRDTEKDLLGRKGGYKTLLSKNTYKNGCPHCGGQIVKEQYLGGSVYYCVDCQPLVKD